METHNPGILGNANVLMLWTVATFLLSAVLTRLMIAVNIQDIPQSRSSHAVPTPRAGGVGVVISFLFAAILLLGSNLTKGHVYLIVSALLLVLVNLLDDIRDLPQRWRFLVQFICALTILAVGWRVELSGMEPSLIRELLEIAFTVSGVVFAINATNFIDGLNGLLVGTVAIAVLAFVSLLYIINAPSNTGLIPLAWIFFASLIGFLIFNYPRAYIFIGDVGSTFIGLCISLAAIAIQTYFPEQTALEIFNRGFILALFPLSFVWFDVAFTLLRRLYLRRSLIEAHREHLFQILHRCGHSHQALSGLYFCLTLFLSVITILCATNIGNFTHCFLLYIFLQTTMVVCVFNCAKKHRLSL
ncbi:MAG: hypothetical protein WCG04_07020 [Alphaproteobacteria bacterium]